ncbi:glycine--tRNA ligase [Candidatus Woesearchaeota archaeon]|nr:glycine--tRNA ligase [Candidatus Woesearchaeota archaeon]MBW3017023.1 glycine--tRNA ligase [Candidatus Woesearchaeota archaeon]
MVKNIEEIAVFCKKKGFVYPSSLIYGGFSGFWDYGPLGVELFNSIKAHWWKFFVQDREEMVGLDASVISHPKTWVASGHVASFSDVSVKCKKCKKQSHLDRADLGKVKCEFCGGELDESTAKDLNLLFKTTVGPSDGVDAYMRGETAQGIFLDFKLIADTARVKLPFGVAQIGKCFRNEIAPRDFLFRSREFTIGEFEFFIHPDQKKCALLDKEHIDVELRLLDAETQVAGKDDLKKTTIGKMLKEERLGEWHAYWLAEQMLWFKGLGLDMSKIKIREHKKTELSHYSSATFDLDYEYPFGSKEIAGNANRGQYDLGQHMKVSKEKLEIFDEATKSKIVPRVIEPTFGMDRVFLAALIGAYNDDKERGNIVLKLPANIAPVKVGVFSLVNKLNDQARDVYNFLRKDFTCQFDSSGSIGRRYARADEIGVPYCVTLDFDSEKNKDVTIRDRDSTEQVRIKIDELKEKLAKLISGQIKFKDLAKK